MAASDAFYNNLLPTINDLLDRFGATYAIRAQGVFDSDTLTTTPGSTRSVVGLVVDQSIEQLLGSEAQRRDPEWTVNRTLILKPSALPLSNEEVQVDAQWHSLSKIVQLKPADIVLLYFLDISK